MKIHLNEVQEHHNLSINYKPLTPFWLKKLQHVGDKEDTSNKKHGTDTAKENENQYTAYISRRKILLN